MGRREGAGQIKTLTQRRSARVLAAHGMRPLTVGAGLRPAPDSTRTILNYDLADYSDYYDFKIIVHPIIILIIIQDS